MSRKSFIFSLLFVSITSVKIVVADDNTNSVTQSESGVSSDNAVTEVKLLDKSKFVEESDEPYDWFPIIFYSQETNLGLGAGTMRAFQWDDNKPSPRPNSLTALAYYTLNNQYSVDIEPDLYFKNGVYNTKLIFKYSKVPSLFFGKGEQLPKDAEGEDYETNNTIVHANFIKKIVSGFRVGVSLDWQNFDVTEKQPGGLLDQPQYIGTDGGTISGLGLILDQDNRDQTFWPTKGGYHQFIAMKYSDTIGSDFDFTQYTFDLRHFITIGKSNVLALQGFALFSEGDVPFNRLAQLGGSWIMRGIYEGRYRDNHQIALQAEYRFPIKNRWLVTVFASTGDVVQSSSDFSFSDLKYTFGGGFRYALDPKNKLNVRMDIGISEFGIAPIIMLGEAF
ncbi:MAG: BamA/TamA family outer membrane protein [Thiohalomonadales bacterium]